MTDHARLLATTLGLRASTNADLPMMIEAAAQAAWTTDRGQPMATAVVAALRAARVILPGASVIERTAIADRGQDVQQFRASGLNLAIAAFVYWNSTYLADAISHLRTEAEPLPPELFAHTSPLTWEHIGISRDFLWDRAVATAGHRRPLNLGQERLAA